MRAPRAIARPWAVPCPGCSHSPPAAAPRSRIDRAPTRAPTPIRVSRDYSRRYTNTERAQPARRCTRVSHTSSRTEPSFAEEPERHFYLSGRAMIDARHQSRGQRVSLHHRTGRCLWAFRGNQTDGPPCAARCAPHQFSGALFSVSLQSFTIDSTVAMAQAVRLATQALAHASGSSNHWP